MHTFYRDVGLHASGFCRCCLRPPAALGGEGGGRTRRRWFRWPCAGSARVVCSVAAPVRTDPVIRTSPASGGVVCHQSDGWLVLRHASFAGSLVATVLSCELEAGVFEH